MCYERPKLGWEIIIFEINKIRFCSRFCSHLEFGISNELYLKDLKRLCVEPTSNDMVPWLPYFFTKWDKKWFVDLLNGTVGLDVDVDADVGVDDAVVCSAKTLGSDNKCTVKMIGKTNFNNVNVILCVCVCRIDYISE